MTVDTLGKKKSNTDELSSNCSGLEKEEQNKFNEEGRK